MSEPKKELLKEKLTNTRMALLALLQDFDDAQWATAVYSEGTTWTVADLLGHLTNAERSMTLLMSNIRKGGEGATPDFDLNRWNARAVEKAKAFTPTDLLEQMSVNRLRLLEFIDTLKDEDWAKEGRHGSQRIMSIEQICHLIADHETWHTADIRRVIGAG